VTGGGRGIGAAIARRLAREGAVVTVTGRSPDPLEALVAELGSGAALVMDVTDAGSVAEGMAAAAERAGPVDILVNNAGIAASAPFGRITEADFDALLDVNVKGIVRCSQAVYGTMTRRGWGRIINIASTAGLRGYGYTVAYCASKHAVIGLTRALALESARAGVTVNAVCPGFTATELLERSLENIIAKTGKSRDEAAAALVESNPQGRFVEPEEVAAAVAWLCGPGSDAITGQSIAVAGGEVT
ncbi:MAG: SDR family oxidoreductase, partial [Gammaproteobacteria bacterium]|nr:SDR family oxidoreductase [Gammaproteobacteria bacterium]